MVADQAPRIEIEDPHVLRRGIMYLEPMEATVGTKATIEAEVIRADEESS